MFEILLCHYAETDDFPFYIQYGGHQGSVDMHRHVDFTELVVVLEGSAMHVVGHEKYPVSEGDVFVIARLAETTGYSERQFCRLFKSAFSASPNTFITNLRLQRAQQLLKTTSLPVGEISWTCGYADHNYFSRIFKKYIGLSPSEYRENTLW